MLRISWSVPAASILEAFLRAISKSFFLSILGSASEAEELRLGVRLGGRSRSKPAGARRRFFRVSPLPHAHVSRLSTALLSFTLLRSMNPHFSERLFSRLRLRRLEPRRRLEDLRRRLLEEELEELRLRRRRLDFSLLKGQGLVSGRGKKLPRHPLRWDFRWRSISSSVSLEQDRLRRFFFAFFGASFFAACFIGGLAGSSSS